jgi:hypothetical protein
LAAVYGLELLPAELTAGFEYSYNDLRDAYAILNRSISQTTHLTGGFFQNEWKTDRADTGRRKLTTKIYTSKQ